MSSRDWGRQAPLAVAVGALIAAAIKTPGAMTDALQAAALILLGVWICLEILHDGGKDDRQDKDG